MLYLHVQEEVRHIDLTMNGTLGTPGAHSALARTVGLPLAIAAKLLLDGMYYSAWYKV